MPAFPASLVLPALVLAFADDSDLREQRAGLLFDADLVRQQEVLLSGNVRATAYTHTEADHIAYGRRSAFGTELRCDEDYHSAAADWSWLPLGTKFRLAGSDRIFVVDDYGSALVGTWTVDIYLPSEALMNRWGVRRMDIEVLEFGSFENSRRILADRTAWWHCAAMHRWMDGEEWWREHLPAESGR